MTGTIPLLFGGMGESAILPWVGRFLAVTPLKVLSKDRAGVETGNEWPQEGDA